jgi:putative DNA primase/helicase
MKFSNNGSALELLPAHVADLAASGLSAETITAAGFYSETDPAAVAKILGWTKPAPKLGPWLVIPFPNPDGSPSSYRRVKPDHPRKDRKEKVCKYESPKGRGNHAYFPPGTRGDVLADPTVPLFVTEGEKKGCCLDQNGFRCVALVGVYGWQKARPKDADGKGTGPRELIPDLAGVVWKGRAVYVVFDSDVAEKPEIAWAVYHLAATLAAAGATVSVVRLPGEPDGKKNGADDFIVRYGAEKFSALVALAKPAASPDEKAAPPQERPDDPHRLAAGFVREAEPSGVIKFWRGEFIRHAGGGYRSVSDADMKADVTRFIRREFVRQFQEEKRAFDRGLRDKPPVAVRPVTVRLVGDVLQALRGELLLSSHVSAPSWLDGTTGPDPLTVLPVKNGLLDLAKAAAGRADCLIAPTAKFFAFNPTTFTYNPKAPAPVKWLAFLRSLWPDDPESINSLQEWFGYSLTADTRQQKILFLLGPRRAGKGTVVRVLRELVGPGNVAGPTLNSFATNFGLSPLLDKTVAVIDDARLSRRTDGAAVVERLLTISGEGVITVDRKYRDPVSTKLNTRLVIVSNELPQLGDASGALVGRIILLKFARSWYGREDHKLFDALSPELPGILNWSIDGWKRLQDRGRFLQPASGAQLLQDLEDLSSPVGEFVREKCVIGPGERVSVDDLYGEYTRWAEGKGWKNPPREQEFGRDLRAACPGITDRRPKQNGERWREYVGIRIRSLMDPYPENEFGSAQGSAQGPHKNGEFDQENQGGSAGSAQSPNYRVKGEVGNTHVEETIGETADPEDPKEFPGEINRPDRGCADPGYSPFTVENDDRPCWGAA